MAFEVKWRIENVESWLQTRSDTLYSSSFLSDGFQNTSWILSLSTNWQLSERYLTVTVQRDVEDIGPETIDLFYELSLLASDDSALKLKSSWKRFALKTVGQEMNVKQVEILEKKREAYLPEGALTVSCKFSSDRSFYAERQRLIRSVIGKKYITLNGTVDHYSIHSIPANMTINFKSFSREISFISLKVNKQGQNMIFERKEIECKRFSWYHCKLFVLDARGQQVEFCNSSNLDTLLNSYSPCHFQSYLNWKTLKGNNYLQNGTLKFQFQITYYPGVESACTEYEGNNYKEITCESVDLENSKTSHLEKAHSSQFGCASHTESEEKSYDNDEIEFSGEDEDWNLPSTTLNADLTSLYNDRLFCDTKLQTDSDTFPAHRCVLSARSLVFKKMLTTDMKETAGECINVPDISSDTLRRMLQFLYTDSSGDLEMQSAKDLYIASDKYDIASLKQRCLSFMKKNLCPSNVCEVLVLADMHQDKELERAVNEYVLNYDEEVFGSNEWKLFMRNYCDLAARVMYLKCIKK